MTELALRPPAFPAELPEYIRMLEEACRQQPRSAGLRTCLGVAYAMNYDVYPSMDALEAARAIDPGHFLAQFKYAELLYRLRLLPRAEEETIRALQLAGTSWEAAVCRRQMSEIRKLMREGTQKPAWTRPLLGAALWCGAVVLALCLSVLWMA